MKHILVVFIIYLLLTGCSNLSNPTAVLGYQGETMPSASPTPTYVNTLQIISPQAPSPSYPCRFGMQESLTSSASQTIHLPILTYHQVRDLVDNSPADVISIAVSPKEFDKQMEYLVTQEYQTIYFTDLLDYLQKDCLLPEKPIILTFDDGWVEDYTVVFPILGRYQMVGTFFPPTNWVNHGAKGLLSWDQISQMSVGGMEFGSHTESHAWLDRLSTDQVINELGLSKQLLEEHIGKPVLVLAYPGGSFSGQVIDLAKEEGYQAAVTTLYGTNQDLGQIFILHRVGVHYYDSLIVFASRLN